MPIQELLDHFRNRITLTRPDSKAESMSFFNINRLEMANAARLKRRIWLIIG